jgi:hypothetical protein
LLKLFVFEKPLIKPALGLYLETPKADFGLIIGTEILPVPPKDTFFLPDSDKNLPID